MDSIDYNVTKRRPRHNKSADNSPNSSFISMHSDSLPHSLPDLSTACSETEVLQEKFRNIKMQLDSAHLEIEQLILENNLLKNKITELEIKVKMFNNIYLEPRSSAKKMKCANKKNIESRRKFVADGQNTCCDKIRQTLVFHGDDTDRSRCRVTSQEVNLSEHCILNENNSCELARKRLFIFGGQQCVGLASKLILSRENTCYENYELFSITKPFANTKEILKPCYEIIAKKSDLFILCVGEHDKNPIEVMMETAAIIKYLENYKIIIVSVMNNKYLNKEKLNNNIQTLCRNSYNCTYINSTVNQEVWKYKYVTKYQQIKNMCNTINLTLDSMFYDKNFVICKNWPIKYKIININSNKFPKKGTIPYYFKKVEKQKLCNANCLDSNSPTQFFRSQAE